MKKKKKPVQVNIKALRQLLRSISHLPKTQKTRIRNTAMATLAVVLIVGVMSSQPVRNYFKLHATKAAGYDFQSDQIVKHAYTRVTDVYGDYVVYVKSLDNPDLDIDADGNIYIFNKTLGNTVTITPPKFGNVENYFPKTDGKIVAWAGPGDWGVTIYWGNISDPQNFYSIPKNGFTQEGWDTWDVLMDVYDGKIAFVRNHPRDVGGPGLFFKTISVYDTDTDTLKPYYADVSARKSYKENLHFDYDILVWEDSRNDHTPGGGMTNDRNWDIYMLDLASNNPTDIQITSDVLAQSNPIIYEDLISYNPKIYGNKILYISEGGDFFDCEDDKLYSQNIFNLTQPPVLVKSGVCRGLLSVYDEVLAYEFPEYTIKLLSLSNNSDIQINSGSGYIGYVGSHYVAYSLYPFNPQNLSDADGVYIMNLPCYPTPVFPPSPADGSLFIFQNLNFDWHNVFGAVQFWMKYKYVIGDKEYPQPDASVGTNTSFAFKSDTIEVGVPDGVWKWAIRSKVNDQYCGEKTTNYYSITKKTGADLLAPTSGITVTVNTKFDWSDINGSKNYVVKLTGGPVAGITPQGGAYYIPLNNGGGTNSQLTLGANLYNALTAGKTYTWSIAGTALNGGGSISPSDTRLPKLTYSKSPRTFKR